MKTTEAYCTADWRGKKVCVYRDLSAACIEIPGKLFIWRCGTTQPTVLTSYSPNRTLIDYAQLCANLLGINRGDDDFLGRSKRELGWLSDPYRKACGDAIVFSASWEELENAADIERELGARWRYLENAIEKNPSALNFDDQVMVGGLLGARRWAGKTAQEVVRGL